MSINNGQSLINALQKAYAETKDMEFYEMRKQLKAKVGSAVDEALTSTSFDDVLKTYRSIEEANKGESLGSELVNSDVRENLERILTKIAVKMKDDLSKEQKKELFEINVLYRYWGVAPGKALADDLGLELTPELLKLVQNGLMQNSVRADQFYILEDQFGVPFTAEVARRYVDIALRKSCTHVIHETAMDMMSYFGIKFSPEKKQEYVRIMVKNGNFDDAQNVARYFGLPVGWIEDEEMRLRNEGFMEALAAGKWLGWHLAFDRMPAEFLTSFPKERPSDFEKIVENCAREEWCTSDGEFRKYWPGQVERLFKERKKVFYSTDSGETKVAQISAMLELAEKNPKFKKLLTDKDLRNFADIAVKHKGKTGDGNRDYIWLYTSLIKETSFSPTDAEIENVLRQDISGAAFDHYKGLGRELSPEFRKDLFEAQKGAIVRDRWLGGRDLIELANKLGQPIDKQLHIDNLASSGFPQHFSRLKEKYGLPEDLSKEEKKSIYDRVVSRLSWSDWDGLSEVASALDVRFDSSVFIPKMKEHLKETEYPFIEKLEEFHDKYRICGEDILEAFLRVKYAGPAARMAIKTNADREKVVDYFVANRKDLGWNSLGSCSRTCVDVAVIDASVKLGKIGYFLKRVVEEGDVDWIGKTMMVIKSKSETKDALQKSPELLESFKMMYALQDRLLQNGKFSEAERLLKLVPVIQESSLMQIYRKMNN